MKKLQEADRELVFDVADSHFDSGAVDPLERELDNSFEKMDAMSHESEARMQGRKDAAKVEQQRRDKEERDQSKGSSWF